MTPAVSILVPIYNVSTCIERCAHSLFQQTFDDIEYIFINDCTPDDSIDKLQKIIEQYPNRKERIKIIHHEKNRGLAAARNTAIENSTGKYIQHIDSDDWVELDMIEAMYNKVEAERADVVTCNNVNEYTNSQRVEIDVVSSDREENFYNILFGNSLFCMVNKLVKNELYKKNDCRPIEGLNYGEDRHTMTRIYFYAHKIVKVDEIFYHINRSNENKSITSSKTCMHFENMIEFWCLLDKFLDEKKLYEKYKNEIGMSKTETKVNLITHTNSYRLRKKYAYLFRDFEMKYISRFRLGEKLILFFTHYRMYFLAHLTQKLIGLKNNFLA